MMIVSCGQIPRKCPTHCILISRFHTGFRQNPHRSTCNGPNTLDFFHINQLYLNKSCKRRLQLSDTLVASSAGFDENKDGDGYDKKQRVQVDLQLPRRRKLVSFTCNLCGARTERLVNPIAWEKGLVIAQCEQCKAWHKLSDAANFVEEIRFDEESDCSDDL